MRCPWPRNLGVRGCRGRTGRAVELVQDHGLRTHRDDRGHGGHHCVDDEPHRDADDDAEQGGHVVDQAQRTRDRASDQRRHDQPSEDEADPSMGDVPAPPGCPARGRPAPRSRRRDPTVRRATHRPRAPRPRRRTP